MNSKEAYKYLKYKDFEIALKEYFSYGYGYIHFNIYKCDFSIEKVDKSSDYIIDDVFFVKIYDIQNNRYFTYRVNTKDKEIKIIKRL